MTARILFVDDNANMRSGLRRLLHSLKEPWHGDFAESGEAALKLLAEQAFDVVVADMRMPGIDGATLLERVRREHPGTARLILSGHADRDAVLAAAGPTQQFLTKPCDAETLSAAIRRALAARDSVPDQKLRDMLGGLTALPKPPDVYHELVACSSSQTATLADVAELVERDVALTAEVLKLVNSAFFVLTSEVDSVERAVGLLGLDVLQALALAGTMFRPPAPLPAGLDAAALSRRSVESALAARRIGTAERWDEATLSALCLGALLKDVGLLALAAADPEGYARLAAAPRDAPAADVEIAAFGVTVAKASAYLLGLWGFPRTVIELVSEQPLDLTPRADQAGDAPVLESSMASPAAVAIAVAAALVEDPDREVASGQYLTPERLSRWRKVCILATD